jgi:FkbM family methyltransferase
MPRALLNQWYGTLGEHGKSRFYERYSKIFRETDVKFDAGDWTIKFYGCDVKLPLRPDCAWLDWDNAVSILGHDLEIKQTYAALLTSDQRPNLFMDVGANYGMHSTLFLTAGIPVLAFEPNPSCFACFRVVCELNGFSARWESVAIGNKTGKIELVYPERETWLGSVSSEIVPSLMERKSVIVKEAPIKRLDDYINDIPRGNVVLKIDVEGFELEVLRGASQVLSVCKPKIIFETNDSRTRVDLYGAFEQFNYVLYSLPWRPSIASRPLVMEEFLSSPAHNFIAIANNQTRV